MRNNRQYKCLGLIKDLVVTLSLAPFSIIIMDVVVIDIPPKFDMFLFRSWASKLKGTLEMDMAYATIPLFGEHRKLYREKRLAYVVNSQDKPENYPICEIDTNLGSSIFYNDFNFEEEQPV